MIDATVAGQQSNSYVTLAFADGYFADTLDAREWLTGHPPELRASALCAATAMIDAEVLDGEPLSPGCPHCGARQQALRFPRQEDVDDERGPVIPDRIMYATCELALALLRAETDGRPATLVGQARWEGVALPRRVRKLLRPFQNAEVGEVPV